MESDWIFSRSLKGKKSILSPAKVRMIKNIERGFRSLKKDGERTRWTSKNIREMPKSK